MAVDIVGVVCSFSAASSFKLVHIHGKKRLQVLVLIPTVPRYVIRSVKIHQASVQPYLYCISYGAALRSMIKAR